MITTLWSKGGIVRGATAFALLAGLSACASGPRPPSYPVPDEPGIYSFTTKNDLRRLDGDSEWEAEAWPERSNLPSNIHFVVNDPALVGRPPGSTLELWRVAWVRSDINASNQAMPVAGSQWAVAPIEPFNVPFRYESPADQPEVVHIAPAAPLPPGLYTVRIAGARQARIGIVWNSTDQRQYSAANCVDRYVAQGNAYRTCTNAVAAQPTVVAPAGNTAFYSPGVGTTNAGLASLSAPSAAAAPVATQPVAVQPVVAQPTVTQPTVTQPAPAAAAPRGLEISLVKPVKQNNGLLIQGTVVNNTSQVLPVPAMQATLKDAAGQDLRRWVFNPPVRQLAPGQRAVFKTEVQPVPAGAARANVAFLAGTTM